MTTQTKTAPNERIGSKGPSRRVRRVTGRPRKLPGDSGASQDVFRAIERSGLTQTEICDRLDLTTSALSKYLHGYPMGAARKARLMEWVEGVLGE